MTGKIHNPIDLITEYIKKEWPDLKWKPPVISGKEDNYRRYEEKMKAKGLYINSGMPKINWLRLRCGHYKAFWKTPKGKWTGPKPDENDIYQKVTGTTIWEAVFEYRLSSRNEYVAFRALDPLVAIKKAIETAQEPFREDMESYFKNYERAYKAFHALTPLSDLPDK